MTEDIVKQFIHRLFNSDLSKDGKSIREEKLPYINLPLYKYCSVCENDKRTEDTVDYNIDNFEKDILYFQNPAKFNDPFDCYLGFSQTQIVRDIMIQQLKQQHQYMVEEFLRARLGNEFEDNESKLIKTTRFKNKQAQYCSVSLTLEQLTLKELNDMVLVNNSIFKIIYDLHVLELNLDALRVLRNKVGHHNFLLAETYNECSIDGIVDNTLKHNIINLKFLLPCDFRQGFIASINKCVQGLSLLGKEILLKGEF